ncbi:MAG: hypothetical protein JNG88_11445 [Phycisphaerales bacterium]|nr:hypothetical protein [Phycisphaerales bacterium]
MPETEDKLRVAAARGVPGRELDWPEIRAEAFRHAFYGAAIGISAGLIRERIAGNIHWETLAAVALLLGLGMRLAWIFRRVMPRWRAHQALSGCAAIMWTGLAVGMPIASLEIRTAVWEDFANKLPMLAIATIGLANIMLGVIQAIWRPRFGPYCDDCGYDIRGLPSPRCPECGRELSERELEQAGMASR